MTRSIPTALMLLTAIALPLRADEPPLSLQSAVAQALMRHERAMAAQDGVTRAQLGVTLAESSFNTKILPSASGWFGQSALANQRYGMTLSRRFTTGTEFLGSVGAISSQNQLGKYYSADTTLLVTQPMLRGFGSATVTRGVTMAETQLADARRAQAVAEQDVALEVAAAYYDVVRQRILAQVVAASLERARQLAAASAANLKIGRVSQLDVLRAEQLLSHAEAQKLDADASVEDSTERLRHLLGLPFNKPISVASVEIQPLPPPEIVGDPVEAALGVRAEVRRAQDAVMVADTSLRAARSNARPQFDLGLAITRQGVGDSLTSGFGADRFRLATFSTVSVPLDRTSQDVELQTAVLDRGRLVRELENVRSSVALDTRRTLRQHDRAVKSMELAARDVSLAAEEVEVARLRFDRGLSNSLDLVNAEEGLLQAEARRVSSVVEVAMARLTLRRSLGILDPRADIR